MKKTIYFFDIDGVIVSFETKEADLRVVAKLEDILKSGSTVVFNTGRAMPQIERKLIARLNISPEMLNQILIIGEFGAVTQSYDSVGKPIKFVDSRYLVPNDLKLAVAQIIKDKYSDSTFWDSEKEGIISAEMKDGYNLREYQKIVPLITSDLAELVAKRGLTELNVIPTLFAIDIRSKLLNKIYSTHKALELLKEKTSDLGNFCVLGDQPFDFDMAEEIFKEGYKVEMVYVGELPITKSYTFSIINTKAKYIQGALEFLGE